MISSNKYIQKLGIGTVQFGLDYGISNNTGKVSQEEVSQILQLAKKKGISYLDTARAYGDSEQVVGQNISTDNSFKIVSKFSPNTQNIQQEIETSLRHLQADSIYAYLFHDYDTFIKSPSLWEELKDIKSQGKVKKIGFSLYYPSQLETLFEKNIDFDILQLPYNLFDRRFESYFEKLNSKNVEIHIRSVFLQGLFFMNKKDLSSHFDSSLEKLSHLHTLAEKYNLQKATLPLFFVLNNPNIDIALLGLSGISDLEQNLSIIEEFEKIEKLELDLSSFKEEKEEIILPFLWKK
ncbi:aldo/keto reductase [Bernardetia sp.]|uniref:aldo/keto reductase n=1 Tax=Bernardetia sp. TaxID=1937974 RepID=UPI0025BCA546|nr:aldo/keto reductase [Bernardetia sp.]